jgi:DNA-directed RNA polymerase specialized sigma24 family protein
MQREHSPHTWQPTVLVNELYLELVKIKALSTAGEGRSDREAFLAIAAHIMKRMLIHHARPLYRHTQTVDPSDELDLNTSKLSYSACRTLIPSSVPIVEMRVFEGFSIAEIASEPNCAPRTVDRRWSFARKWLEHQLAPESQD